MLDIGFPELVLIAIVGLLVIGPERLPGTLRTLGLWLGRLSRSFSSVKAEIEKEIGMDEVKRQLHNEAIKEQMKRIEDEVKTSVNESIDNASIDTSPAQPDTQADAAENSIQPPTEPGVQATDPAPPANAEVNAEEAAAPTVKPLPPTDADLEAAYERKMKRAAESSAKQGQP